MGPASRARPERHDSSEAHNAVGLPAARNGRCDRRSLPRRCRCQSSISGLVLIRFRQPASNPLNITPLSHAPEPTRDAEHGRSVDAIASPTLRADSSAGLPVLTSPSQSGRTSSCGHRLVIARRTNACRWFGFAREFAPRRPGRRCGHPRDRFVGQPQGLMSVTAVSAKSLILRVARVAAWQRQTAAICASALLIGRPDEARCAAMSA